jgi:hemoglobin
MRPDDTSVSRTKLFDFMTGWLGGPPLYIEKRGHPRRRMRHVPFASGDLEAADWRSWMAAAMEQIQMTGPLQEFLTDKLTESALHLRNQN